MPGAREFDFREAALAVPALGLIGAEALREAFEGDFKAVEEQLRAALLKAFKLAGDADPWPWVKALFPDSVIIEREGKFWSYPYSVTDGVATLGAPVQVEQKFLPMAEMKEAAQGPFLEAAEGKAGARYKVRLIRAGLSNNGNFYPDQVLREAAPRFEGVRVFVKGDEEHLAGKGKDVRNLIGRVTGVAFVEGRAPDSGELTATLELIEPEGDVAVKLREAFGRGMAGLFGLSIDARGPARISHAGGRPVRTATAITKVNSVDLIVEPGAGGEIVSLIEANNGAETMDREQIIALIEAARPQLLAGKDKDKLGLAELEVILREALAPAGPGDGGSGSTSLSPAAVTRDEVNAAVRMVEARAQARAALAGSGLPEPARDRLQRQFDGMASFTEAQVTEAIKGEKEYLARFTEAGQVQGLGAISRIELGETRAEKVAHMLEAFFDPAHKDHRHAQSFKEVYVAMTGDRRVTGQLRDCDQVLMREALDTDSLANVLGDGIRRRMVADYGRPNQYDIWKELAEVTSATDFRVNERTRMGGYGDLPVVDQSDPYEALESPTDEKATFAVKKRGGTEEVTLEMIKNDDAGAVRRIPTKLAQAAKRTLSKFVLDFLATNPEIYDEATFFHNDHGNLGTSALSAQTYAAARLAMLKQTELDSGDRLGIAPRNLWVPSDLEEAASNLFKRDDNIDETFVQSQKPRIIVPWYWTDPNNWFLTADKMDIPILEIAFLDGQEEPEIFVQDNPAVGSMFSHDKLTWKIRHIYGGAVLDYRGAYAGIVANPG